MIGAVQYQDLTRDITTGLGDSYVTFNGTIVGALAGVAGFNLDSGLTGGYQNLFPDYYSAVNGSTCVQLYNTASRCAILHFSGAYRVFSLGFPLEIVVGAANRASLMEKMLVNFE